MSVYKGLFIDHGYLVDCSARRQLPREKHARKNPQEHGFSDEAFVAMPAGKGRLERKSTCFWTSLY